MDRWFANSKAVLSYASTFSTGVRYSRKSADCIKSLRRPRQSARFLRLSLHVINSASWDNVNLIDAAGDNITAVDPLFCFCGNCTALRYGRPPATRSTAPAATSKSNASCRHSNRNRRVVLCRSPLSHLPVASCHAFAVNFHCNPEFLMTLRRTMRYTY